MFLGFYLDHFSFRKNKHLNLSWVPGGPDSLLHMFLLLSQLHNYASFKFLPTYYPSPEEKKDTKLFAENVRAVLVLD
jgi:lysophosphatidylcholine acyltransferase/lyso-PAF acetyltransferase